MIRQSHTIFAPEMEVSRELRHQRRCLHRTDDCWELYGEWRRRHDSLDGQKRELGGEEGQLRQLEEKVERGRARREEESEDKGSRINVV
ncbi:putative angiomotin-like protein 2 [Sesbania bispinosa]|nr:putative angiomotin-like protein 2 [Sesbania bispinosa]